MTGATTVRKSVGIAKCLSCSAMDNGVTFRHKSNYNIDITYGTFVKVMVSAVNLCDTGPCFNRIYSALIPARPRNHVKKEELLILRTPENLIP